VYETVDAGLKGYKSAKRGKARDIPFVNGAFRILEPNVVPWIRLSFLQTKRKFIIFPVQLLDGNTYLLPDRDYAADILYPPP